MSDTFKNLEDVEKFLETIPKFSKAGKSAVNFDLSRMMRFCNYMGNPQTDFKSIHVAGTNGKGTVCRMLASVFQEAGYIVGLYTSPHLIDIRERFQINGIYIEANMLIDFFKRFSDFIEDSNFTYFEITTAIAFWYFSQKNVDIAILEVGLGGRLDATNVVTPMVSVIVSIGVDHTDILGESIEEIASEKAGIIKPNIPVVIGKVSESARSVFQSVAEQNASELISAESLQAAYKDKKIVLHEAKSHFVIEARNWKPVDAQNAAIVYRVVKILSDRFPVKNDTFIVGIEKVQHRFPRRAVFEKLLPDLNWYFDGAHNTPAVKALITHLTGIGDYNDWTVVLSFMKDKLNSEIADNWSKFDTIYVYPMEGERAATTDEMTTYFPSANVFDPSDQLLFDQLKTELVIFSGSFYFYSIISNWMGAIASADQLNPPAL